jgi:hypothetical protein
MDNIILIQISTHYSGTGDGTGHRCGNCRITFVLWIAQYILARYPGNVQLRKEVFFSLSLSLLRIAI